MAGNLSVVARMIAAPDTADELVSAMQQPVEGTRKKAGCPRYDLFRGTDDPDVPVFVEERENQAHWQAHVTGIAIRASDSRSDSG